jgi:hypothetical protein
MQSTAKDVTAYLEEVPAERKAALEQLRKLCLSAKGNIHANQRPPEPGAERIYLDIYTKRTARASHLAQTVSTWLSVAMCSNM